MRARKTVRNAVIVAAFALLAAATLCPAQCLVAAGATQSAHHCHDGGAAPPTHPMLEAACCPTLLTVRSFSPVVSTVVVLPPPNAWRAVTDPAPRRVASREHPPPGIAPYLRIHALLI